jgi:hypothetical protein
MDAASVQEQTNARELADGFSCERSDVIEPMESGLTQST